VLLAEYRLLGFRPPKADDQAATTDGLFRPPSGVAFVGRLTSALMGVLTVLAVGWIGWSALSPWTGLLSSLFLALTWMGILEPHVAVLVFGRDIGMLLTAVILYATTNLRDFHPSKLGKANSLSQVVAIGVVLLNLIYERPWLADARTAMLDATIFLTVASGFHYAWVASQRIGLVMDSETSGLSATSPRER